MESQSTFSLRYATFDDCHKLASLEKICNPLSPWTISQFESELEKKESKVLLVTDDLTDEIIAGYCVFVRTEGYTEILLIGVSVAHRSMGFAQKLISNVVSESMKENAGRVILNVRESNSAAISLYQKLFFNMTHKREGFYSNGDTALEMELKLEQQLFKGN